MPHSLFIKIPENFNFKSTVYSHGWCELAPFELDDENWRLRYVFRDGKSKRHIAATISEEKGRLRIDLDRKPTDAEKILMDVRRILRLDDDLDGLYESITGHERLSWVAEKRAGRLLRSPTVFEDLVKTICTTNCSWSLTKIMVTNLVEKLGEPSAAGTRASSPRVLQAGSLRSGQTRQAFPTPETMASVTEDFYRTEIKAGYRSPYFVELAEAVASGKLDPQSWLTSDLPTPELKKEMKKVKGVGDYAAENLLKLVGRYDGLALDSWLRSQFYKNHNKEKVCPDKKIERHYKKFGPWRGLVIWCDMTEKWIN
ncbi:MAG: DNA-3-methyladenine glycosylase family protein [Pyrinomonadaceae bacterium]